MARKLQIIVKNYAKAFFFFPETLKYWVGVQQG